MRVWGLVLGAAIAAAAGSGAGWLSRPELGLPQLSEPPRAGRAPAPASMITGPIPSNAPAYVIGTDNLPGGRQADELASFEFIMQMPVIADSRLEPATDADWDSPDQAVSEPPPPEQTPEEVSATAQ